MVTMKTCMIIFGRQGTAAELYEYISDDRAAEFNSIYIVSIDENILGNPIVESFLSKGLNIQYIFGVLDPKWRSIALSQIDLHNQFQPFTYVHPKAVISKSAEIGKGVYIGPSATISPYVVINDHAHININASIGHHSKLLRHSSIMPGARVSGNCVIGERTLIGSNSVIFQGVEIGSDCAVDAQTYVKNNVSDNNFAYGVPAKIIRRLV